VTADPASAPGHRWVALQRRVEKFWSDTDLVSRALALHPDGPPFRFTEGPPTANGRPHLGHALTRALKDVPLRYRRMRGYRIVTPMAGWDCHGLPVELEIEKRHGFRSKREIEAYGVDRFCEECRASVFEYVQLWQEMSRSIGFWLDYEHAYVTMKPSYIESVWWSLKTLFDRGLLSKGFYTLPYCPRCETPLSSHEVAQGYKELTDPSIVVRFDAAPAPGGPPRHLLVWTTTPWTLPANLLIAAKADLTYVGVQGPDGHEYVLAQGAAARYFPGDLEVLHRYTGSDLNGLAYSPLFPTAGPGEGRYRVVLDDFVGEQEGTGLVHVAPSFGPDDQRIGEREHVGFFDPLDSHGVFTDAVPLVAGKGFKAADPVILEALRTAGALHQEDRLRHTYPTCWRCATPLLYRALDSWFVRSSALRDELIRNNEAIRWFPAHMQHGRFGNFLDEAKDWALSRNRYWGTPLPIWSCTAGHFTCIGSFEELGRLGGAPLPADFDPHRTQTDRIHFPCPTCGAPTTREAYTIDAWYDSGSAPYAQYHYPFEPGPFDPGAPLDHIGEGLDQTRGWFYTLHVLATALFHRPAYTSCLVNGFVLDDAGQKMSKSKGNVLDPMTLLGDLGGDALRWAFYMTDYTESARVSVRSIQLAAQRTLGTLLHVYEFYRSNAEADRLRPAVERPTSHHLLDRWLLSRLEGLVGEVTGALDSYDSHGAAIALAGFVDDLSTWYLRRSRSRFWTEERTADRHAAHATLSYTLWTLAHLFAPLTPFLAEHLFQQLTETPFSDPHRSVHFAGWPSPGAGREPELEHAMAELRSWVEVGRELRQRAGVKSRFPLPTFVLETDTPPAFLRYGPAATELLQEELNVRSFRVEARSDGSAYPADDWVRRDEGREWVARLSRSAPPELYQEGLVREALRRLQQARKEAGLAFTDRIRLTLWAGDPLAGALRSDADRLRRELLVDGPLEVHEGPPPPEARVWELDDGPLAATLEPAADGKAGTSGPASRP
jgi:isoleucyl-tRNA synthetase